MLRLYDFLPSGNCYKVRLLLTQLGIDFERIDVDILRGLTRTDDFKQMNPNGRVPVLELEDGRYLSESNAIMWYLADGTELLPEDRFDRADVLRWMFFEQYSHEPYIATVRFWIKELDRPEDYRDEIEKRREPGVAALTVMNEHLGQREFFVGDRYSIADIALYAYTHVAPEGGFSLQPFPALRAWLARVREQPSHLEITEPCG